MGTEYYAACADCREYIDLHKFYSWETYRNAGGFDERDLAKMTDDPDPYGPGPLFVKQSLRLHYFLYKHNGHRVGVFDEYEFDPEMPSDIEGTPYKEICPWA